MYARRQGTLQPVPIDQALKTAGQELSRIAAAGAACGSAGIGIKIRAARAQRCRDFDLGQAIRENPLALAPIIS